MTEATISSVEQRIVLPLFGAKDQHLRRLREKFDVDITHRNGKVKISGEDANAVAQATEAIEQLTEIVRRKGNLTPDLFNETIARVTGESAPAKSMASIETLQVGREIRPRTEGQAEYVDAIRNNDVVFAVGPAGTGKTYLAVAMAVDALKNQRVRKIILVRPAVEAGESLGFLPGEGGRDVAGILAGVETGEIGAVWLLGADEIDTERLENAFVIYQGHHGDAGAHCADGRLLRVDCGLLYFGRLV